MSFLGDRKRQHEAAAAEALAAKDFARSFFHAAEAAECGLKLAELSEGKIARRYADDAWDLIDIAARLKSKARSRNENVRQAVLQARRESAEADEAPPASYELTRRPGVRLEDVAGLDEVKEILREKVIDPFLHPEAYQRFRLEGGGGVLLYGPPGNGKTFMAKAIAGELEAAFFEVRLSEMKSKYVGETAKNLQRLFDEARIHERAVVFLDECEALLGKRGTRKVDSVPQFLALTDGLAEYENCLLLLAASNQPWRLDEAVLRPGRLGTHIYVGLPDADARRAIVEYHMRGVPLADGVSFQHVADKTKGYSGADVAEICRKAKQRAVRRQIESDRDESVTRDDLEAAVAKVAPSTTPGALAAFGRWRDTHQQIDDQEDG